MYKQSRSSAGPALAAVTLLLLLSFSTARAAELEDFIGEWSTTLAAKLQTGEETEAVSTFDGRLELERTGVTLGGVLVIEGPEGVSTIPIGGATLQEDGRLKLEVNFSDAGGDNTFDAVMQPLFGDLGIDADAGIRFIGWLDTSDDRLTGRIDAEGFSMPGVIDAVFLEVSGERAAEPEPLEPEEREEDGEFQPEAPTIEAPEDLEPPDLSDLDLGTRDDINAGLHAGGDADVEALEAEDLADQEAAIRLSAARAIAEQERKRRERAEAQRKLERVHTFEYEMLGDSIEQVVADASMRALLTTASRLYYGNFVLIGRDLLEPYLRQNGEQFLVHVKVLGEQAVEGGQRRVRAEVAVDTEALYDDLESKHFIAEPNYRPVMVVALDESLNDQPNSIPLARVTLQELLRQVDMRVEDQELGQGLDSMDLTTDEALLRRGRLEAQRLGADVLVTGTTRLYGPESRVILFDQFYEVSGGLTLHFIRTDNGEVIRTWEGTYTAKATVPEDAIEQCFFNLGGDAVVDMTRDFLTEWQNTMLDRTEYRLCITGADEKLVDVLGNELRTLSPEAQLYLKSHFSEVAVLNFNLPGADRQQLESFLHKHRAPQFKVIPTLRGHYELRVL